MKVKIENIQSSHIQYEGEFKHFGIVGGESAALVVVDGGQLKAFKLRDWSIWFVESPKDLVG